MATFAQSEVNRIKRDIEYTQDSIRAFEERLQDPNLTPLQRGTAQRNLERSQAKLATLQAELAAAEAKVATEPAPQPAPAASASQTAQEDGPQGPTKPPVQEVGADGRITAAPPVTPATNATPTETTATNADTNTNPETVTLQQSQATTPQMNASEPLKAPAVGASADGTEGEAQARAQLTAGVGAGNADAPEKSRAETYAAVDAAYNASVNIKPQDNVLDKFSSYTYQASVYLMSPKQYEQLLNSKNKTVNGYQLLFQSGGAANNVGGSQGAGSGQTFFENNGSSSSASATPGAGAPDAGRNPFFDHDFYIDNIVLENQLPGKATGASHMVTDIKFTVIEPMGMTLIDRLYSAVKDYAPQDGSGAVNYTAAVYLMVIRFFGYDIAGNLVTPGTAPGGANSNPTAVVEKFVPFLIKNIKWTVSTKAASYDFECGPVGQFVGSSTARGTIPYDVQLTASTVGKVLKGKAQIGATTSANPGSSTTTSSQTGPLSGAAFNNSTPPQKANAAPTDKKTITGGLMDALNQYQKELVTRGIYSVPDEYELEFANGSLGDSVSAIENATIVLSDNKKVDLKGAPMAQSPTQAGGQALDSARQVTNISQRSMTITAGQQVVQAIELAIRNSSYIYNQSLLITKADGSQIANPEARNKPMKWFLISMSSTQLKYDPQRNDYAYRIKYTITPYRVPNFDSKYFPITQFPGLHKQYNYWFTGQNNAVLDYKAELNTLYQMTVSGSTPENSFAQQAREKFTFSMRDIPRYVYSPRSTESASGGPGKSNEVSANAAENLNGYGELHSAKIKIIGDPSWIQQGSLFRPISSQINTTPGFLPDGTIDFDSSQVLFEIAWQRPEDYNLGTGLADPYAKTEAKYGERKPLQSNVYQAIKVVNEFKQGKFEQTIDGSLYYFPKPDGTNAMTGNAASASAAPLRPGSGPDQSAAETNRLKVQNQKLLDDKVAASLTSVTGTNPTSSLAQGVQQILNPPKTLADPTLTQLTSSQAYISARRSGQTPEAALQAARNSFAGGAGGSPVSSNGLPVATNTGTSPPVAGNNTRLTAQQIEQLSTSQRNPQQVSREY